MLHYAKVNIKEESLDPISPADSNDIQYAALGPPIAASVPGFAARRRAFRINSRNLSLRRPALFAMTITVAVTLSNAQEFYLHDGDRVTFYGDSITAQRLYTQDIEAFVDTRYPMIDVSFHNAGVPGDRVSGGYAGDAATRVTRDVAPFKPTVLTVMLGMNEGGYTAFSPDVLPPFLSGYAELLKLLRQAAPGARITLLENTSYDEVTHGTEFPGYMETTNHIAEATPSLAAQEKVEVIDTNTPVRHLLLAAAATEPKLASLLIRDRIHPGEAAHWIIAATVMKAWHANPIVSEVDLNAGTASTISVQRTSVSGLAGDSTGLKWQQKDEALPLPLDLNDSLVQMVLRLTDLASLDQQTLRITGLKPGKYNLLIDQRKISGPFSSEQLSAGINLALMPTPMVGQAREVRGALDNRSKLEQAEFFLRVETSAPGKDCASQALSAGEQDYNRKIRENLIVKPHQFEIAPLQTSQSAASSN
jgi:lysophospholipase L1-like esterase